MRNSPRLRHAALLLAACLAAGCGTTVPLSQQQASGGLDGSVDGTQQSGTGGANASGGSASGTDGSSGATGSTGSLSSSSSTSGGSTTSGTSATVGGPTAGSGSLTSGKGWDAKNVYVGLPTVSDADKGFAALGVSGADAGDPKADANAMIAELNRHGGILGRRVKLVNYDFSYTAAATNATATAQAACSYFTQDHPVVAVINPLVGNWDNPAFEACITKHRVALIEGPSTGPFDATLLRQLGGYFYDTAMPSIEHAITAMVPQLVAQGFFSGWNTTTGAPGPAPAKVGLLYQDGPTIRRVLPLIRSTLAKAGHPVATEFGIQSLSDGNAAVLRMRSAGVTHVFSPDIFVLLMMLSADSQRYRPRYTVGTYQIPQFWMQNAPPSQLVGSMGIGWYPTADVAQSEDPGPVGPGQAACRKVMLGAKLDYARRRTAQGASFEFCDGFNLLALGAKLGGGLDPFSLTKGIAAVGSRLQVAGVFGNGLSQGYPMVPDQARALFYDGVCSCFRYRGSSFAM